MPHLSHPNRSRPLIQSQNIHNDCVAALCSRMALENMVIDVLCDSCVQQPSSYPCFHRGAANTRHIHSAHIAHRTAAFAVQTHGGSLAVKEPVNLLHSDVGVIRNQDAQEECPPKDSGTPQQVFGEPLDSRCLAMVCVQNKTVFDAAIAPCFWTARSSTGAIAKVS